MKPLDPVTLVAALAIAAFAIDRLVSALLFLLSYAVKWADPSQVDAAAHERAERSYKLAYFTLACLLALAVYFYGNLSVFTALGFPPNRIFDALLTMLVLVGGCDRVAALLKAPDAAKLSKAAAPAPAPIQIAGTVTLGAEKKSRGATP
jgi:hypothetical protein